MERETILTVENMSVTLDGEEILRDISFSVKKGEALAIIGPNGAGKSVLIRALLGMYPFQGKIAWQKGIRIGYVPQRFAIEKNIPLTVREFFLLKSGHFWLPSKEYLSHLGHELQLAGLGETILKKRMGELSGGELQRVLISWAMVDHPEVLLFDEPTAGVDIGAEDTIYTILHKMQDERGTTLLLISHDLTIVYRYAENVLCINKEMICHGNPQEVLHPEELSKIYGGARFYHHTRPTA